MPSVRAASRISPARVAGLTHTRPAVSILSHVASRISPARAAGNGPWRPRTGVGSLAFGPLQPAVDCGRDAAPIKSHDDARGRDTAQQRLEQHAPGPRVEIRRRRRLERHKRDHDEHNSLNKHDPVI